MNLLTQKRLAGEIMKVGERKVWIDPTRLEDVSRAITRDDVKHFISIGVITAKPSIGNSRGRLKKRIAQKKKGRQSGHGRRTGKKTARTPRKESWMNKVRALRDELNKLKEEEKITESQYRKTYKQIKGNLFNSRRHMRENLKLTK